MKKMDFLGMFLIMLFLLGVGYIFLYIHPQEVTIKTVDIGIAKVNSSCYQKLIEAGGFKNTYEMRCRTRVEWEKKKREEIVELPFPLLKGEGVAKCEVTLYPYLHLPPRRQMTYRRY